MAKIVIQRWAVVPGTGHSAWTDTSDGEPDFAGHWEDMPGHAIVLMAELYVLEQSPSTANMRAVCTWVDDDSGQMMEEIVSPLGHKYWDDSVAQVRQDEKERALEARADAKREDRRYEH